MFCNSPFGRRALLAAGLLLGAATLPTAQAQPGSGGPGPGTPTTPTNPTDVPLDGGASLLLASGVGYGLARLRQARAAKKTVGA
ncbi:hypothetical protein Q5H92_04015 [Hymenobacter sp. M29]|uniref:VPDSG-CTERM protein sorting domain-containing protein n=1 Tax=Hymenobacter mellowenesis TaxID=3063995 RepID=A0ABT9A971_9BACT|nr:hypothetical protein [Hymenobacter sp. M29]MDO7845511.1 hypothetical protein [Hymenobacter sp. M29]